MNDAIRAPSPCKSAEQRFVEDTWPLDLGGVARVRHWRLAGRAMLLSLLTLAALQYYFCHVYLTILTLPRVTVLGALTDAAAIGVV